MFHLIPVGAPVEPDNHLWVNTINLVGGGSGSFSLNASVECGWQAVSTQSWLVITSTPVGLGNSTINYTVSANTTVATRTGEILAGGHKQKGN